MQTGLVRRRRWRRWWKEWSVGWFCGYRKWWV